MAQSSFRYRRPSPNLEEANPSRFQPFAPSPRPERPDRSRAEMCTNTSVPQPSRAMKPKPFSTLNHFTVPRSSTDGPLDAAAGKPDRRGGAGTAVLVSTLRTSVMCGPLCPGPTRTSTVSPGCTALMLLPARTPPCRKASPDPSIVRLFRTQHPQICRHCPPRDTVRDGRCGGRCEAAGLVRPDERLRQAPHLTWLNTPTSRSPFSPIGSASIS